MEYITYLKPIKIIDHSDNLSNLEYLFSNTFSVNRLFPIKCCSLKGKGYIILDFGKEYFGGIRISLGMVSIKGSNPYLRIRFGESLMEANCELGYKGSSNDHSPRDMTVFMGHHSDMVWGSTAFRFVRIDFLEDESYQIENILLAFKHEERPRFRFESSNEKLNKIMEAASRTLWLNKQYGVFFEGAKRDQHIWAGDLFPEIYAALYSFKSQKNIKNSLNFIIKNYPTPTWYNDIPSYNAYFVLTLLKYFELTQHIDPTYLKCISDNVKMFKDLVDKNFILKENIWGLNFLDWSTFGKESAPIGIKCLFAITLKGVLNCKFISSEDKEIAKETLEKLKRYSFTATNSKPVNALGLLSGLSNKQESLKQIKDGGCSGYTVFLSYFILKALADNDELEFAYKSMLEYFGGMIDIGATTLFEEFDISWLKNSCKLDEIPKEGQNDFHGDFGSDCFVGYRKSLCHAWASGVIPFVVENIIGLKIKDNKFVSIKPNLFDLDYINCSIPTRIGDIKINIKNNNNALHYDINIPEGMLLKEE